LQVAKELEKIV
jgi:hypothetical protein